ncbi:MAG: lysophospholipase [Burkholderiales bacterium]|nr:lysophospholipase [Burkholderiales bacterium]
MDMLRCADGVRLHLRRWPTALPARGTVQIVHGLGEHIERYAALAARLNAQGWHVAGHDQRGHGRSEGPRGSVPSRQALLCDLAVVTDHLRSRGRHVLLGHSLGGLIAARFVAESLGVRAARWVRDVDALVLSSPALALGLGRRQRLLLALLARATPALRLGNGLQPDWISRDAAVVHAYRTDPLVHDRITPRLLRFMVESGHLVAERAAAWRTPTLLLWAGADRCVLPAGSAAFAGAAPPAVVQAQYFDGLAHEIFNEPEPDREQVLAVLTHWLARF